MSASSVSSPRPAKQLRDALRSLSTEDAAAIPTADRAVLIGEMERVKVLLWITPASAPSSLVPTLDEPDRLLSARETAGRLGRSLSWLYEHKRELPFWKTLPGGGGGFSEQGLKRFLRRTV